MADVLHGGAPITGQELHAGPVEFTVTTKYEVTDLTVTVDGQPVPATIDSAGRAGAWRTTVAADLAGAPSGAVQLDVRVQTRGAWTTLPSPVTVAATNRWVNPADTGIRVPRSELTPSPSTWLKTAGAVYERTVFTGIVRVQAGGVRFVDCLFLPGPSPVGRLVSVDLYPSAKGVGPVLEHCELDGSGVMVGKGIASSDYTLRHCNIHHVNDGVGLGSNCLIEYTWIHDLVRDRGKDLHPDCIQTTGGLCSVVRRNYLDCREINPGGEPGLGNAAVMVGCETEPELWGLLVEDNYLDGGNYTINVRNDGGMYDEGVTIRRNTFGGHRRFGDITAPKRIVVADNIGPDLLVDRFGRQAGGPPVTCPVR